ncbi:TPA: hypothetical protein PXM28_002180 [Yersinia enterocolitica]|nr:hypothetical protein [Yersinia enterocolitica]
MGNSISLPSIYQVLSPKKYKLLGAKEGHERDSGVIENLGNAIREWNVVPRGPISKLGPALTDFAKNFCQSTSWEHLKGFFHQSDEMDNLNYMATLCVVDIIKKLDLQLTTQDGIDLVQLLQKKGIAPKTTIKNLSPQELAAEQLAAEVLSLLLKKNPLLSSNRLFKLDVKIESYSTVRQGGLFGRVTFGHAGTEPGLYNGIQVPFFVKIDDPGSSGTYEKGYKGGATLTNVYGALSKETQLQLKRTLQEECWITHLDAFDDESGTKYSNYSEVVYKALFNEPEGLLKAFHESDGPAH